MNNNAYTNLQWINFLIARSGRICKLTYFYALPCPPIGSNLVQKHHACITKLKGADISGYFPFQHYKILKSAWALRENKQRFQDKYQQVYITVQALLHTLMPRNIEIFMMSASNKDNEQMFCFVSHVKHRSLVCLFFLVMYFLPFWSICLN